ncbi:mobile element protein [Lentilactobacillus farraginis DSM 18382 = JCM 14108]|uniref:Mobile element protein n=2 Tax=Lentilactobacillus farraginis TaxID=390841 RepID=X0QEH4_9LACO|nr:RNA-guided endonuclease TnpB family protein [Lentilactobacillus farraginis]GAF37010.1 mobile element protein [Lentilactobacillus farraginis DSM 18382 = JCM 14108]
MFGNDRFVWNHMLAMANQRYENNPASRFVGEYDMNYLLKPLKKEYPFLKLSDATSLLVVNHNLALAYQNLFQHRGGHPRFKSRHSAKQAYTGRSICLVEAKRRLKLPKIGSIRTSKTGRLANAKIKRYTISHESTGRYYISLQVEIEVHDLPKTNQQVGLDLGVSDLAIDSTGVKYGTFNAQWLKKQAQRWQAKFSRRRHQATVAMHQWNHHHKLSKMALNDYQNWQRAKMTKARYQTKIANQRKDYLHKLTTALVRKYDVIVIEDLKTKNLMRNHHLAKAIANASWYQFRTMLEYKCDWYGKRLVVVSANNTSRICSSCGHNGGAKPLAIREWTCHQCQTHHDRDINAAVNILKRGLKATG